MRSMLDGVRVIDFSTTVAGPTCTLFLADMGAEVIKVERPGLGDESRLFPPHKEGQSAPYIVLNRGKKCISLDVKKPEGLAIFKDLVKNSDVLVENFRPGVMKRLGLDYETLKKINPKLIMCSISGYGQYGPLASQPAYDAVIQAMTGIMSTTGHPDNPPQRAGTLIMDISSSVYAVSAVCAALFAKEKTGEGEYLDISMYDVGINLLEAKLVDYTVTGKIPQRSGNKYPYVSPFDTFKTSDGYIFIICIADNLFKSLCDVMGRPELKDDERFANIITRNQHAEEIKEIVENWTSKATTKEIHEILMEHNIPGAPVNNVKDVVEHPHTKARDMIVDIEQPGAGTISISGSAIKALNSEIKPRGYAPANGEHNDWVLENILKKKKEEIEEIKKSGALGE